MKISDGKFGIKEHDDENNIIHIHSQSDLDSVGDLNTPLHTGRIIECMNPKINGACSGIIEMECGKFHILGEDDGNYWTQLIVTKSEIRQLVDGLTPYLKQKFISRLPVYHQFEQFEFELERIDRKHTQYRKWNASIIMKYNGRNFKRFNVAWVPEFVKLLKEVE